MRKIACLPLLSLGLFASACTTAAPTAESPQAVSGCDKNDYPCAPYGTTVGSVIADLQFQGKTDSNGDGTVGADDAVTTFDFTQFYNRNWRRADLPKVLAIDVCAMWCGPCNLEARDTLNPLASGYRSSGAPVEILSALAQDRGGNPATLRNLDQWDQVYLPTYDTVIDPTGTLLVDGQVFPTFIVVRTRDMQITYASEGDDVSGFKSAIDAVLAEPVDDGSN
jgi:hypothetical protein